MSKYDCAERAACCCAGGRVGGGGVVGGGAVVGAGVVGAAVVAASVVVGADVASLITGSVVGIVETDAADEFLSSLPPDTAAPMMITTTIAPTIHGHFFLGGAGDGPSPAGDAATAPGGGGADPAGEDPRDGANPGPCGVTPGGGGRFGPDALGGGGISTPPGAGGGGFVPGHEAVTGIGAVSETGGHAALGAGGGGATAPEAGPESGSDDGAASTVSSVRAPHWAQNGPWSSAPHAGQVADSVMSPSLSVRPPGLNERRPLHHPDARDSIIDWSVFDLSGAT